MNYLRCMLPVLAGAGLAGCVAYPAPGPAYVGPPPVGYAPPVYGYVAPPPVYYGPPPVIVTPGIGLDFYWGPRGYGGRPYRRRW